MATEILAVGSTAADSADQVVAAGATLVVALKGQIDMNGRVIIKLKDDLGAYHQIGALDAYSPAQVLSGAGTYRLSRIAGGTCGVFSG